MIDIPTWLIINLQDSNSYSRIIINEFHDFILIIITIILSTIIYIIIYFSYNKNIYINILHNQLIETIWTIIPIIILIFIAIPSLKILYIIEEALSPYITIKTIGYQWYWRYDYADIIGVKFDSFIIKYNKSNNSNFRLLDVDNRLILPYNFKVKNLVSSIDVIHSWSIPRLGIKIDCTPGRINQTIIILSRPGLFYGQCSEICGLNHRFIPIVIERISLKFFFNWLLTLLINILN